MINLSQIKKIKKIIEVFFDAVSSLFPALEFNHVLSSDNTDKFIYYEISTLYKNYGFTRISKRFETLSSNEKSIIRNAVKMLAIIIENRENADFMESEKKRLEHIVKKRTAEIEDALARLEETGRIKEELLALMSHEVKTPLNGILGFSKLIKSDIQAHKNCQASDEIMDYLDYINKSAGRLDELLTNLIELSSIKAGIRKSFVLDAFDVEEMVEKIEYLFYHTILKKEIKFQTVILCEKKIYSAPLRIQQIFFNLIGNAVKFTKEGIITVRVEKDYSGYLFSVEDTGIGIEASRLNEIFEEFKQLDDRLTLREYQGIGLGLSLCKRFVEDLGGRIWVTSRINGGSIFYFKIPFFNESDTV
jgi:signal transduction histidine kinase